MKVENLPDVHWEQCCLPIVEGGLGFGNLEDCQHSAYAASFIACYNTAMKENFRLDALLGSRGVLENGAVVKTIVAIIEIFEKFHILDPERFHDIGAFFGNR